VAIGITARSVSFEFRTLGKSDRRKPLSSWMKAINGIMWIMWIK
jgi:hypothetical protein